MRFAVLLMLAVSAAGPVVAGTDETYKVYTDHPRLFLRPQRLRLLKRERQRQTMRWNQFESLIRGGARMPEPGFALALYYAVTGDAAIGKKAVENALTPQASVREQAIVYDWCQDALDEASRKALQAKLEQALARPPDAALTDVRDRVLAAVAVDDGEAQLTAVVNQWWRGQEARQLQDGLEIAPGGNFEALLEILHAVRDNLNIDLREDAPDYFKALAAFYVAAHYPAPYPAAENEYRIPIYAGAGEPNLNDAALSRVAGLMLVAYDTNAVENQFVQGWLIQDRFMLRGTLGAPYEFLWADPYLPGLAYEHLPLAFHDQRSGALFLRSSWEENATWFGLFRGEAQVFQDGRITVLKDTSATPGATDTKVTISTAEIVRGHHGLRLDATGGPIFVIGLQPRHGYDVEIDDEEMTELVTDPAGTLTIATPAREAGIRIR